jgi:DHA1 family bicyclomycin/chloramphenicol resistance-like MFS transporter
MLVTLAIYTAASLGAACAGSFGGLLACRALQGISAGAGTVIGRAMLQDRYAGVEAQRAMAQMTAVFALSPALAPVLGGWLQSTLGWRSVFLFLAGFGALLLVLCWRSLPETLAEKDRQPFQLRPILRGYADTARHPRFMLLGLAPALAFGGMALYIGAATPFVMHILGKSENGFAWLFVPLIAGLVAGSSLSARLASGRDPKRATRVAYRMLFGASFYAMLYYGLFEVVSLPWAVLPIFLYAAGVGAVSPGPALAAMDMFPEQRGLAASMLAFLQMLLFSAVSGLAAPLLQDSGFSLACGMAGFVLLSFLCWAAGQRMPVGGVAGEDAAAHS